MFQVAYERQFAKLFDMEVAKILRLFVCQGLWRYTGLQAPGRVLVQALGEKDEDTRTIAGMFLVKAGKQAEPLLEEALREEQNLPTVLTILGDIGDKRIEAKLRQYTLHQDPVVAQAACDALQALTLDK